MNITSINNNCSTEKATNPGWCPNHWDQLLCWKTSKPDVLVFQACFTELNGLQYDTSQNASRYCKADGIWEKASDYMNCKPLEPNQPYQDPSIVYTSYFYYGGYTISLVALVAAVSIFIYFKDLRCLRNTIHTNLMCSYILSDFTWILTSTLQEWLTVNNKACLLLTFSLHYFMLTNFFWMFVEGLYLYILVVETFTRENIKLRVYMFIGWGIPLVIIIIWGFAKMITSFERQDTKQDICTWMSSNAVHEWIYQGPAVLVLVVNLIFLSKIMWVLITKLRSANSAETQQYRKASKALLVLIPLLGVTYILTMVGPTEPGTFANYYSYGRATLLSMQGFMVAIFYCFVNSEVKNTFKHHIVRWNDARNLRTSGSRRFTYSKDWSPNTRSDSVRLARPSIIADTAMNKDKRASTVSSSTTMTFIVSNGPSGGGVLMSNACQSRMLNVPPENPV